MPAPKAVKRQAQKDAVAILKEDHVRVRKLLGELVKTSERAGARRAQLLATIEHELKTHPQIEEDVFYPAFRDAAERSDDRKLYYEAVEEHHVVDMVLPEIKKTRGGSEEFAAKVKVLKDLVDHHAREEEKEMFPRARKLMDREERRELGERLAEAKMSLMKDARGLGQKLAHMVRS